MSSSVLQERIAGGSFLSEPQRLDLKLGPPSGEAIALRTRDDYELSQQLQRSLDAAPGRRKIWEFATNLHCSIIGTCLSTAELRQILVKLGRKEATTASEHDLHVSGVLIAGQRHEGAKLLHIALDRRHRVAINQFGKTKIAEEVRAAWKEAVQRGDIAGAYWASLTHPATNDALLREIFAEVHMLSHLVGGANRADIRRLRQLEEANTELEAKVGRQQQRLRTAIISRDATIQELRRMLEERIARDCHSTTPRSADPDAGTFVNLVADLKRLAAAESRGERLERQLETRRSALNAECNARAAADRQNQELRQELEEIEARLADIEDMGDAHEPRLRLPNLTLLYVGGRQAQIGRLRMIAERAGATLLHHDGGIEERSGLLQGLVSRADAVLFPVDCISHAAMAALKRICRQSGKAFLPLRGAGLTSFCAALNRVMLVFPALPEKRG